jgi:hydrogenase-4 component D
VPVAAFAVFLGAFALAGIPPLPCFWSKLYVLVGALQAPGALGPIVLVLVLVESLVAFAWFLWVGQKVFFGKAMEGTVAARSESAHPEARRSEAVGVDPPKSMDWVLIGMMILTVGIPIAGIPIVNAL